MLAVIGGTGYLGPGKVVERIDVVTPYGLATVDRVKVLDEELFFIPRHWERHELPPHIVNYRANIYALKKVGAKAIFATYACGAISKYKPGNLVLLKDFISFGAPMTFFDDFSGGIKHVDFSEPYDRILCNRVRETSSANRVKLAEGGVIATTSGPRYETRAEIAALKTMGANLVSMTAGHEAALAHELEFPLAGIGIVTNYACGVSKGPLKHEELLSMAEEAKGKIDSIVGGLLEEVD
jgi:5'-methylthioadenosine phosphorylase